MAESLEHKCCIPECKGIPRSVMTAKKDNEMLSFYACGAHEPAVWKYTARKYAQAGYNVKIENIIITNTGE